MFLSVFFFSFSNKIEKKTKLKGNYVKEVICEKLTIDSKMFANQLKIHSIVNSFCAETYFSRRRWMMRRLTHFPVGYHRWMKTLMRKVLSFRVLQMNVVNLTAHTTPQNNCKILWRKINHARLHLENIFNDHRKKIDIYFRKFLWPTFVKFFHFLSSKPCPASKKIYTRRFPQKMYAKKERRRLGNER